MKILKKIIALIIVVLVVMQFFQPKKNNGELSTVQPFVSETNPPKNLHKILKSACFDCHSNATNYPWYSNITPVNFWMADHVKEGKDELNFSEWKSYSLKRKEHKMEEIWEEVAQLKMPIDSYTWTHFDAKLTEIEIKEVVDWAKNAQSVYKKQLMN
ncbi:heme-binding domain-containing protein [Tenacibaculum haliotis]|uniref:heme-binding domain-containing protein n=1 Tax=Tenacibaculum haliotis TaxID=1888914 RepID=UPI0021B0710A|nr:heme-binding domain-containing protein [Tenacibaculum haliotis]MCT4699095.1 heme-binding domain-containing protein [Tenacibaculum haliotis]